MNKKIKNYIFQNYNCNSFVLLEHGTCILFYNENEIKEPYNKVKNVIEQFSNGNINYKTKKDSCGNNITTYDIPNVLNIVFKEDKYKTNQKELLDIQGRNNLIKDIYNISILEVCKRDVI